MNADHDVIVVGAGFAGLYAVHKLRDELGLRVQGLEAAGGVGGTWWWNRYPGARCDFESVHYSYSFSDELQREWEWTERFAAQPEILSYLEWVADRLDVRRAFRFGARVTSAVWSDQSQHWAVTTDDGQTCTARFVVMATGNLSVPKTPEFPGLDRFRGRLLQTSAWPHEPVDFAGKRVGIIGTGATGIQAIPVVAREAAHLTVFQRTPNFAAPLGNAPVPPAERRWLAEHHAQVRAGSRENFLGAPYEPARPSALADSPEERRRVYDEFYGKGGFRLVISTYQDLLFSEEANDTIAEYIRDRIRERVKDPKTAELLCPRDHPYATKRAPFETGYYEAFNRDNVELVDVRSAPIETLTETGLRTTEAEYELDIVILATGFDAITGPLLHMGIVGREGLTLNEKWAQGPRAYLGIAVHGFPNLFTITGPQSASAFYNNPLAIEDHVDFCAAAIKAADERGARTFEPTQQAERAWGAMTEGLLNMTLLPKAANSYYMGANIPGKPRAAFIFLGGAPLYRAICQEVEATGFGGFALGDHAAALPPIVQLEPAAALELALRLMNGNVQLETSPAALPL